ncbi:MAG: hypothetical protein ACJAXF_003239, partial [Polaribacter sp.]
TNNSRGKSRALFIGFILTENKNYIILNFRFHLNNNFNGVLDAEKFFPIKIEL